MSEMLFGLYLSTHIAAAAAAAVSAQVDIGRLLQRTPKLLMKPLEQLQADAQQVTAAGAVLWHDHNAHHQH
jgi:hypothetical protein